MTLYGAVTYQKATPGLPGAPYASLTEDSLIERVNGTETKQTIGDQTVVHNPSVGTYTITITLDSPTGGTTTETLTYDADDGTSDDATTIATALVAAINGNANVNDVLEASNVAGVISYTLLYPNVSPVSAVTGAATGTGNTLTASPTVTDYTVAASIPYGYAVGVYPALGDGQCAKVTTATDLTVLGVAFNDQQPGYSFPAPTTGTTQSSYEANRVVTIFRRGIVWVPVAAAVVRDTQAHIVATTGQFTANGAGTAVPGAFYRSTATAGEIAQLDINLPQT